MTTYTKHATRALVNGVFPIALAAFGAAPLAALSQTASGCGPLYSEGQYGPFDYRTDTDKLPIVLGAHFTPAVEALIRGNRSATPGGDIDYTLRAIPNNHRALMAMMRLGEKEKTSQPNGSRYSVECWFERAIRFRPDDLIVRMIYSSFLNSKGREPEASAQLAFVASKAEDNAFTQYNLGLQYLELKNFEKALYHAHKAQALGFPQTALREKLVSAGKWAEPAIPSEAPPPTDQKQ